MVLAPIWVSVGSPLHNYKACLNHAFFIDVFATLMGLDGPPAFKQKQLTVEDFGIVLEGEITASVRYDTLYMNNKINIRWNKETGEFKFSGTYGKRI